MATIKPRPGEVDVEGDDPAQADPVKIVHREGPEDNCTVVIECDEGEHHKLTIRGNHVTLPDHPKEKIDYEQLLAGLDPNLAPPCVRVKIWEQKKWGFYVDPK